MCQQLDCCTCTGDGDGLLASNPRDPTSPKELSTTDLLQASVNVSPAPVDNFLNGEARPVASVSHSAPNKRSPSGNLRQSSLGYPRTKSSTSSPAREYGNWISDDGRCPGGAQDIEGRSSSPHIPIESSRPGSNLMRRLSRSMRKGSDSMENSAGPLTRSRSSSNLAPDYKPPVIPQMLQIGISILRITHRKRSPRALMLDPVTALLSWDTKSTARICVDDIKDIRLGEEARNYREDFKVSGEFENRWMSIIYQKDRLKALHMVFTTGEVVLSVVATITALREYRRDVMSGLANTEDGMPCVPLAGSRDELDFEGVEKLCRQLHINAGRSFLWDVFNRAQPNDQGRLGIDGFRRFVGLLKERREITEIWRSRLGGMQQCEDFAGIGHRLFHQFMVGTQKTQLNEEEEHRIFTKFSIKSEITLATFTSFLLSAYNPLQMQTLDDMSRPLNEYYISSSHNTYLLGRQIRGDSSIEGYIRVLQRGCRCVEIDCWDGPDGPVVTHGRTLTSPISFYDVLMAINKYGFLTSPYPLVLSLEIRCNKENQTKIVALLNEVFGQKLIQQPLRKDSPQLPSPDELKFRIMVKVKWCEEYPVEAAILDWTASANATSTTSTTDTTETDETDAYDRPKARKRGDSKIILPLRELSVYSKGLKFRNFGLPESKTFDHIFSFSERTFNSTLKDTEKAAQLHKHNIRYLMRVYPSGFRFSSSNFDPLHFWRKGVQLVALNWQTYDLGIQINEALFSTNNHAGYVLKPSCLRTLVPKQNLDRRSVKLSLEIISAQQLPRPKDLKPDESLDPTVEVEIIWEEASRRYRTGTIVDNGFNPVWREQCIFEFDCQFPELTFLRFSLLNDDSFKSKEKDKGSIFATYCSKLDNLCQGYRHVPLFDLHGEQYLFSTLFVRITYDISA